MKFNKLYNLIIEYDEYLNIGHSNKDDKLWWWNFGDIHIENGYYSTHGDYGDKEYMLPFFLNKNKMSFYGRYGRYDSRKKIVSVVTSSKFKNNIPKELVGKLKETFSDVKVIKVFYDGYKVNEI